MALYTLSRNKGQAFAPDFLTSIVIVGFMLSIFFISWNSIIDTQISSQEDRKMYLGGERTMMTMITSPGDPEDWDQETVQTIGFADKPHVLNKEKIEEFEQLELSEQRSLLNTVGFKIEIIDDNKTLYEIGPQIDGDKVFSFKRNVILDEGDTSRRVEVRYAVWD